MRKPLKGCLIAIAVALLLVVAYVVLLFISSHRRAKQAEVDWVEHSRLCDTIPQITEQPSIYFSEFKNEEVDTVRFRLCRNGQMLYDTLVVNANDPYNPVSIPYPIFLKTDTVVVTIGNGLHFCISGFHHKANLHYNMFGYIGTSDCRLSEDCAVNRRAYYHAMLIKYEGWADLNNPPQRIYKDTPEFAEFEHRSSISYEQALTIAQEYTQYISITLLFCENNAYLFYDNSDNDKPLVVKVSTQTGECVELPNYPYEK